VRPGIANDGWARTRHTREVIDPEIVAHYGLGLEEGRLFSDGRPRLELVRTLELLDRFLPAPPARVLDVGGGPGTYAAALCDRGYRVHIVDAVESHVARASQIALERGDLTMTAAVGDARALAEATGSFDAVLLLGPLYHLTERHDRLLALAEATRVVRPGGAVIAVGISRFASLLDGLRHGYLSDPTFRGIVERDLRDGQHRNPDPIGSPEWFTTAFFHHPDELEGELVEAGLDRVDLLAIEGPTWLLEEHNRLESQLDAARAVESERSLMGASSHIMAIGHAPGNGARPATTDGP
jgi:SAM-dependent methyltransferase